MAYASDLLPKAVGRVIVVQSLLSLLVAAAWLSIDGRASAVSACYGGAINILSSWWLGRRVRRAGDLSLRDRHAGLLSLYAGAVLRFVTVLVLLAIGLGLFKLAPIPLIVALAVGYLAFLLYGAGIAN